MDVEEFIGKKSYKAKGRKVSPYDVLQVRFVEPLDKSDAEEIEEQENGEDDENYNDRNDNIERNDKDMLTTPEKVISVPEPAIMDEGPRELFLF